MPRPTCAVCGRAFTPRHSRQRHCPTHEPRGRASRSPTTRAQDATYRRHRAIVLADEPLCHWGCGRHATTVDHLTPVARGGGNELANLVPACRTCNCSRRDDPDWTPPA